MATSTLTSTVQPPVVHPVTGLPVQRVATFAVGDLVTEAIGSDGYPAVVVAVEGKGKTVYVRKVAFQVGNVTEGSHANYMEDTTLVVDPESVEQALAAGKGNQSKGAWSDERGATKYVLKVASQPDPGASHSEKEKVGAGAEGLHRARWGLPNVRYGSIWPGARYRRDPHV